VEFRADERERRGNVEPVQREREDPKLMTASMPQRTWPSWARAEVMIVPLSGMLPGSPAQSGETILNALPAGLLCRQQTGVA